MRRTGPNTPPAPARPGRILAALGRRIAASAVACALLAALPGAAGCSAESGDDRV